jgi:hypothetical protein
VHRQKHADSGRKDSSRVRLTIKESQSPIHDERNGTTRRKNEKIFNKPLVTRLEDTNQQIKKWLVGWKPVIDHSMKQVKELAQENSKPIWKHFTANKPPKTRVSRKLSARKSIMKRMTNNPMTNVYNRLTKKRSSSRVINSFYVMAPILAPLFGVHFLQGHISLKNRSYCPLLRASTSPFKSRCLLIRLKEISDALNGPHLRP